MEERRYEEDEVREILDRATTARRVEPGPDPRGLGLTLRELKEIGAEVGVDPVRIAEAARALEERGGPVPRRTLLGAPISVGRFVDLPRAPTEEEWALLVAELRATFGARGRVESSGLSHEWSNGNLHAFIEPTESGWRLRMGTLHGAARGRHVTGLLGGALTAMLLVVYSITGDLASEIAVPLLLGLMSAAMLAMNALTLPGWAAERERQMEYIAGRARALLAAGDESDGPGPS